MVEPITGIFGVNEHGWSGILSGATGNDTQEAWWTAAMVRVHVGGAVSSGEEEEVGFVEEGNGGWC